MSELPLADLTPLRVTGALFKDLAFAFEPQDIPDGAMILRTLKRNGAIIMDELEDASIVLIDTELPTALHLLREATGKIVLHYSWVNKSLNTGHPLLESSNWGDCIVTPDNINNAFAYVPPPPSSNPQLQTPRPTPESRYFNLSTPSIFSQGSAGAAPPSSQPPYTPTPSHWTPEPMTLRQQTPQLPPTNQVAPYNPQPMQPPSVFSPFPMSQPTDRNMIPYSRPQPWTPFHSGPYGMIQQPTVEDVRRAYEVMMMMWLQGPMPQQLPPPPPPTQAGPSFHFPPFLAPQNPPSVINAHLDASRAQATPVPPGVSRRDSTNFNNPPQNLGNLQGGPSPEISDLSTSSPVQPDLIPSLPPLSDTAGLSTVPPPLHTHPKLFEHDVGKPIMFFVPSTLKKRGKIAEIFRVTGGRFTDDVEEADYVVLGQGEEQYFDEIWYSAHDCNKPTVKPEFVIDSREKGRLLDPNDYPTKGPGKPRKDEQRKTRSRPTTADRKKKGRGRGGATPQPAPSGETPKWLRFYKEAEKMKSFQYIGAMFKKNAELTHDALAIHLHNKMSNHTINSWKKYCLHHRETIEDLRKRAVSNAEKRAIPRDQEMADATVSGADEASVHISSGATSEQANPPRSDPRQGDQQANPQQADSRHLAPEQHILQSATLQQQAVPRQAVPPPTTPQPTIVQQTAIQQNISEHVTQSTAPQQVAPQATVNRDPTTQPIIPKQPTSPRESQQQPPPYEKVAKPILVKTEPLEDDQLDFAFATEVLSTWKPNEECDAELWKRMETMRPSVTAPSWGAFCEKHWSRFEHFFADKHAQA